MATIHQLPGLPRRAPGFRAAAWLAISVLWLASPISLRAAPQEVLTAVTDRVTYNAGDPVRIKIVAPAALDLGQARFLFNLRYLGDDKPVASGLTLGNADPNLPGYRLLWKTPPNARLGRYALDLQIKNATEPGQTILNIATFVVHRQTVQMISSETAQSFYTSGDAIACSVKLENLSPKPLAGLRLEFSERYWPWIAQQTARVGQNITAVESDVQLKPHQPTLINSLRCALAADVKTTSIKQYVAVLWDRDRKNVLALRFTPTVFVSAPGAAGLRPYPGQYIYPSLDSLNTAGYRQFQVKPFGSGALQFDSTHTQFPTGAEATIKFSVANPTDAPWKQVTLRAVLLAPDGKEVGKQVITENFDVLPHSPKLTQEVKFALPPGASGIFHAGVDLTDSAGHVLASDVLELGVNPLPKSALIFCAHEDDDTTQLGFIRALVENQVPVRVVYFTSGDAGACDRYYQRTCGPAEALNYGPVRMQESRAALGHMGVPTENILFLGLPDGGTGKIWYEHPHASDPYLAVLLASDHAPYDGLARPNLLFARDAVLSATKEIIKSFQPEVIFTVHPPAEGHIDHIVNNFFVVKAMQELVGEGAIPPEVELRVDKIFDPAGHPATPYHYEVHEFYVSGQVMALAQEATWFYQSQDGNHALGNIQPWDQLPRSQGYRKVVDWKEHQGWNESR